MRDMVWNVVRSKVPEGMILPWWALTVRAVLYPLEFFYWRMSNTTGYQWQNDTWLINGVTYSGESLRWMAKAQGETYRVTRTGETVTLERVHNAKAVGLADALSGQSHTSDGLAVRPMKVRQLVRKVYNMHNECEQTRAWPERTVAVLNNGDTAIVVDDHCYAIRNWNGSEWGWSAWIFREALAALKALPDNPDEAATVAVNAA